MLTCISICVCVFPGLPHFQGRALALNIELRLCRQHGWAQSVLEACQSKEHVADLSSFSLVLFCGELEMLYFTFGKTGFKRSYFAGKAFCGNSSSKATDPRQSWTVSSPRRLRTTSSCLWESPQNPAGSAEEGGRVGKYQEETGSSKVFKIWQPEAEEPSISGLSVLVQGRAGAAFKGGLLWLGLAC